MPVVFIYIYMNVNNIAESPSLCLQVCLRSRQQPSLSVWLSPSVAIVETTKIFLYCFSVYFCKRQTTASVINIDVIPFSIHSKSSGYALSSASTHEHKQARNRPNGIAISPKHIYRTVAAFEFIPVLTFCAH